MNLFFQYTSCTKFDTPNFCSDMMTTDAKFQYEYTVCKSTRTVYYATKHIVEDEDEAQTHESTHTVEHTARYATMPKGDQKLFDLIRSVYSEYIRQSLKLVVCEKEQLEQLTLEKETLDETIEKELDAYIEERKQFMQNVEDTINEFYWCASDDVEQDTTEYATVQNPTTQDDEEDQSEDAKLIRNFMKSWNGIDQPSFDKFIEQLSTKQSKLIYHLRVQEAKLHSINRKALFLDERHSALESRMTERINKCMLDIGLGVEKKKNALIDEFAEKLPRSVRYFFAQLVSSHVSEHDFISAIYDGDTEKNS